MVKQSIIKKTKRKRVKKVAHNLDELLKLYKDMLLIRRFEEKAGQLYGMGLIAGFCHLYIGPEAVVVGMQAVADHSIDTVITSYRDHGHMLASHMNPKGVMSELTGRNSGYSKGKGGSMHLADFSIGILGESGIVASSVPVATGAALTSKLQNKDFVSLVFFGDGASNQGACHESMNLAALWKLPVIFVCENNQFAVTTSYKDSVSVDHVSDRASAYGIPGVLVDGQDVVAMYEATEQAVIRARSGEGPTLIEGLTYRYEDHSLGLANVRRDGNYRSDEELNDWLNRDPIEIHKKFLLNQKFATKEEINKMENDEIVAVDKALEFARKSPYPDPKQLFDDLYTDPISFA